MELDHRDISLKLFPCQEVRIVGELIEDIAANKIQFIDEDKQYLLIEFPIIAVPYYTEQLFFELQKSITPIIVHSERNHSILNNLNELLYLVERKSLGSIDCRKSCWIFWKKIQKLSYQVIQSDLVHFIASDVHSDHSRNFYMKEAYEKLEKEFGKQKVKQFNQITKDLINGELIVTNPPKQVQKNKFLGLF